MKLDKNEKKIKHRKSNKKPTRAEKKSTTKGKTKYKNIADKKFNKPDHSANQYKKFAANAHNQKYHKNYNNNINTKFLIPRFARNFLFKHAIPQKEGLKIQRYLHNIIKFGRKIHLKRKKKRKRKNNKKFDKKAYNKYKRSKKRRRKARGKWGLKRTTRPGCYMVRRFNFFFRFKGSIHKLFKKQITKSKKKDYKLLSLKKQTSRFLKKPTYNKKIIANRLVEFNKQIKQTPTAVQKTKKRRKKPPISTPFEGVKRRLLITKEN